MRRLLLICLLVGTGCGDQLSSAHIDAPAASIDTAVALACTNGYGAKIKFEFAASCLNDGSVEFCIPDNDAAVTSALAVISPTIHCYAGGGRANCSASPGLLLCMYPTAYPAQCTSQHGAMTAAVWSNMCDIAARPEVSEIVPTIVE